MPLHPNPQVPDSIQHSIDSLSRRGGTIQLEAARYTITAPLQMSNCVTIVGEGTAPGPGASAQEAPTCIAWDGPATRWMVEFDGPGVGGGFRDLALDAGGRAGFFNVNHFANVTFRDVTCYNYAGLGMLVTTKEQPAAHGSSGLRFDNFSIVCPANRKASGVWMTGEGDTDSCSNLWTGGVIAYGGDEKSYGLRLEGADNNTWMRTHSVCYDAAVIQREGGRIGPSLQFVPWHRAPMFPIENVFISCSFTTSPEGEGDGAFGNLFLGYCGADTFQDLPLPKSAGGIHSQRGLFGTVQPVYHSRGPDDCGFSVENINGGRNDAGSYGFRRSGTQVGALHADYFNGLSYLHHGNPLFDVRPDGIYFFSNGQWRKVKLEEQPNASV